MVLQAIFASVYGLGSSMRLRQQGMEFAVWVFKHASDAQLKPRAGDLLAGLMRLLDTGKVLELFCEYQACRASPVLQGTLHVFFAYAFSSGSEAQGTGGNTLVSHGCCCCFSTTCS